MGIEKFMMQKKFNEGDFARLVKSCQKTDSSLNASKLDDLNYARVLLSDFTDDSDGWDVALF